MDNLKCKHCGSPALVFVQNDEYETVDDDAPRLLHVYGCLNCGEETTFEDEEIYPDEEPGDDE